ncbi:MAG: DUF86 domain-containing protein [Planctomycetes bacterium]|nr:DUF86 domain-containing protein [Planctomycetota bacterium]
MVDSAYLAKAFADIRDGVARIREVLPAMVEELRADRTRREVVVLNLFVALQECLSVATHWLADEARRMPVSYRDAVERLGELGVLSPELTQRLDFASEWRSSIALRSGTLEVERLHEVASRHLGDLELFCAAVAQRVADERSEA